MKGKRNVLIVTDGSGGIIKMAAGIAEALKGHKITVKTASEFQGNDILPADTFFIGCENPRPDSFSYLVDLLKHVNLAGRLCGVFTSGSAGTARYLAGLVRDSEAALNPEVLLAGSEVDVKTWTQNVITHSF